MSEKGPQAVRMGMVFQDVREKAGRTLEVVGIFTAQPRWGRLKPGHAYVTVLTKGGQFSNGERRVNIEAKRLMSSAYRLIGAQGAALPLVAAEEIPAAAEPTPAAAGA